MPHYHAALIASTLARGQRRIYSALCSASFLSSHLFLRPSFPQHGSTLQHQRPTAHFASSSNFSQHAALAERQHKLARVVQDLSNLPFPFLNLRATFRAPHFQHRPSISNFLSQKRLDLGFPNTSVVLPSVLIDTRSTSSARPFTSQPTCLP